MAKGNIYYGKNGKILRMFPDLSGGLNTADARHLVHDTELVEGANFDLHETGAISKRKGFSSIVASLGAGGIQGSFMHRRFTYRELLAVHQGKLYRYVTNDFSLLGTGFWEEVPIRRHAPQGVMANVATTGTVGPNLVASTSYDYQVFGKDATGTTLSVGVPRGTQGATPRPITVSWDKVFGCTGYDIYRNGKRIASVGDVGFWIDDGSVSPTLVDPPTVNTSKLTIPLTSKVEFVSYMDKAFFTTGAGICVYDGTDASLVTPYIPTEVEAGNVGANDLRSVSSSIHKCRFLVVHKERLFVAGDPDYPQNWYFTDSVLSPQFPKMYFPGSYSDDVTGINGSPITGLSVYRDTLILFTSDSIHGLFGDSPSEGLNMFVKRVVHPSVGCEAPRSIVTVNNALVFVSKLGVYALTNVVASQTSMNVQLLSKKIKPTFDILEDLSNACAVYHDYQYKISFPADEISLRWYVEKQSWALDTVQGVSSYVLWETDLYMASSTNGILWKYGVRLVSGIEIDSYSDDGDAINFYVKTKSYDMDALLNRKKTREVHLLARQYDIPSSIQFTASVDYESEPITWGFELNESTAFGTWSLGTSRLGWVDVVYRKARFKGKGRLIDFTMQNNVLHEPLTVYGIGIEYKLKSA